MNQSLCDKCEDAHKKNRSECENCYNCDEGVEYIQRFYTTFTKFIIKPLKDLPVGDNSLQYRMTSHRGGYVDFATLDEELCAHSWFCPKEGRTFLEALEKYAETRKLKLTIPTVLNGALEKILKDNGYTTKQVPYMGDVCELWSKEKKQRKEKKQ